MTDQDKPNSTSGPELEVVNEYTLTGSFLQQFKKYKLGMLEGEMFTVREQQAIMASAIGDPQGCYGFLAAATAHLRVQATEEFPMLDEVIDCLTVFNGQVLQVLMFSAIPLLKMTPEQKAAIREAYVNGEFQKPEEQVDAFSGLDFDMNGPKQP